MTCRSQAFHDFELMVPVIGPIPTQLMSDEYADTVTFTKPHEIIAITSILPVSRESICRSELTDDTHLAVYAVSTQPVTESPTQVSIGAQSPSNDFTFTFTFTFMHLADAFIQSDLHCIQVTVFTFYQLLLSLGIKPMILALLAPCSTI